MKTISLILFSLLVSVVAQDEESTSRKDFLRLKADLQQVHEKMSQIQNDARAATDDNASLRSQIQSLKSDLASAQDKIKQQKNEIEHLSDLIKKLDTAWQQDRKLIVEEIGQEITRIRKELSTEKTTKTAPAPKSKEKGGSTEAKPSKAPSTEEGYEHVVAKGETLKAIAEAYGVTMKRIRSANHLKSDELKVGQKLFVPEKQK